MFNQSFFNLAGSITSRQWAYGALKYATNDAQKAEINDYVTNGTPLSVSTATGVYGLLEKYTFLKTAKAFKGNEDRLHTILNGEKYPMGGKAETFACDIIKGVYLDTVMHKNVDQFAISDQASKVTRSGKWDSFHFRMTSLDTVTIMSAFASESGITNLLGARTESFIKSIEIRREAVAVYKLPYEIKKEFLVPAITNSTTQATYNSRVANENILIDGMTRDSRKYNQAGFMRSSSKNSLIYVGLPTTEAMLATNVLPYAVHDGFLGFGKDLKNKLLIVIDDNASAKEYEYDTALATDARKAVLANTAGLLFDEDFLKVNEVFTTEDEARNHEGHYTNRFYDYDADYTEMDDMNAIRLVYTISAPTIDLVKEGDKYYAIIGNVCENNDYEVQYKLNSADYASLGKGSTFKIEVHDEDVIKAKVVVKDYNSSDPTVSDETTLTVDLS